MTCSYDGQISGLPHIRRAARRECPGRLEAIPRTVGTSDSGPVIRPSVDLGERFQSSNHMGCLKRPHSVVGKPKMQLSGFMESVV
jgi:hypothetical protein